MERDHREKLAPPPSLLCIPISPLSSPSHPSLSTLTHLLPITYLSLLLTPSYSTSSLQSPQPPFKALPPPFPHHPLHSGSPPSPQPSQPLPSTTAHARHHSALHPPPSLPPPHAFNSPLVRTRESRRSPATPHHKQLISLFCLSGPHNNHGRKPLISHNYFF